MGCVINLSFAKFGPEKYHHVSFIPSSYHIPYSIDIVPGGERLGLPKDTSALNFCKSIITVAKVAILSIPMAFSGVERQIDAGVPSSSESHSRILSMLASWFLLKTLILSSLEKEFFEGRSRMPSGICGDQRWFVWNVVQHPGSGKIGANPFGVHSTVAIFPLLSAITRLAHETSPLHVLLPPCSQPCRHDFLIRG